MPLCLNFIIQMSLFLKTSYEQSKTLLNCLGETLQLVECLDSLNTDLMQRYSVQGQKHPIASVCLFRSGKIIEKKRSVCLTEWYRDLLVVTTLDFFRLALHPAWPWTDPWNIKTRKGTVGLFSLSTGQTKNIQIS